MGLNLNSLKNISLEPTNTASTENTIVSPVTLSQKTPPSISQSTASVSPSPETKTPSVAPKISLMQLKKASGINNSPVISEVPQEQPVQTSPVEITEKISKTPVSNNTNSEVITIQQETIINTTPEQEMITPAPVESIVIEEEGVIKDSNDGQLITIFKQTPVITKELPQTTETKEFFPNFQISNQLDLDDDLLGLDDIITEQGQSIIPQEKSILTTNNTSEVISDMEPLTDTNKESIISSEIKETISEVAKPSTDTIAKIPSNEAMVITPEYVAEVKTELSEGRRAGFRFFVKNNKKIVAGVGVLFSISAIALFSSSFFGADIQQSGKSNIQEVSNVQPNITGDELLSDISETGTISRPETTIISVETPNYELGRDYNIVKNTKKNIQTKKSIPTASEEKTLTP